MLMPQVLNKKHPDYAPHTNVVGVAPALGSQAQLQLRDDLPERVIAHTAVGRQGKKRRRNRRRRL